MEVMSLSPTPNASMHPPWSRMDVMEYSSRLLEAMIRQSSRPASSSLLLTIFVRYARSPESRRTPLSLFPIGSRTSFAQRMALGVPDLSTS